MRFRDVKWPLAGAQRADPLSAHGIARARALSRDTAPFVAVPDNGS